MIKTLTSSEIRDIESARNAAKNGNLGELMGIRKEYPDLIQEDFNLSGENEDYDTISSLAIEGGHLYIVQFLAQNHYDILKNMKYFQCKAMGLAVYSGQIDIVKYFADHYPEILNQRNRDNENAAYEAATSGNLEMVKYFAENHSELFNEISRGGENILSSTIYEYANRRNLSYYEERQNKIISYFKEKQADLLNAKIRDRDIFEYYHNRGMSKCIKFLIFNQIKVSHEMNQYIETLKVLYNNEGSGYLSLFPKEVIEFIGEALFPDNYKYMIKGLGGYSEFKIFYSELIKSITGVNDKKLESQHYIQKSIKDISSLTMNIYNEETRIPLNSEALEIRTGQLEKWIISEIQKNNYQDKFGNYFFPELKKQLIKAICEAMLEGDGNAKMGQKTVSLKAINKIFNNIPEEILSKYGLISEAKLEITDESATNHLMGDATHEFDHA